MRMPRKKMVKIKMTQNDKTFDKRIAIILIIAMLINSAIPAFTHMVLLHFTIFEWLIMNICAPTMIATSIGLIIYIYKPSRTTAYYLIAVSVLLFRFAIGGFFVPIPFSIQMIQAEIAHIFMIITGIYIIYFIFKDETKDDIKSIILKGILPGIIIMLFISFILFPVFFSANPNIWSKYSGF